MFRPVLAVGILTIATIGFTVASGDAFGQAAPPPGSMNPSNEPAWRPYTELDLNHDGNLSVEEYGKAYPDSPYDALDKNGDGRISEKEYQDGAIKGRPKGSMNGKP